MPKGQRAHRLRMAFREGDICARQGKKEGRKEEGWKEGRKMGGWVGASLESKGRAATGRDRVVNGFRSSR